MKEYVLDNEDGGERGRCESDQDYHEQGEEKGVVFVHDSRHEADENDRGR